MGEMIALLVLNGRVDSSVKLVKVKHVAVAQLADSEHVWTKCLE